MSDSVAGLYSFRVSIPTSKTSLIERVDWCMNEFKDRANDWMFTTGYFYFKKSEDATMFALRWGC